MPYPFAFLKTQSSGPPLTGVITSFSTGMVRSDFTGDVGEVVSFSAAITIKQLAMWIPLGNPGTKNHTLKIWNTAGTSVLASVVVNSTGVTPGTWLAGTLSTPYSINISDQIFATMSVVTGEDAWLSNDNNVTAYSGVCYFPGSAYGTGTMTADGSSDHPYGPVNIYY